MSFPLKRSFSLSGHALRSRYCLQEPTRLDRPSNLARSNATRTKHVTTRKLATPCSLTQSSHLSRSIVCLYLSVSPHVHQPRIYNHKCKSLPALSCCERKQKREKKKEKKEKRKRKKEKSRETSTDLPERFECSSKSLVFHLIDYYH